MHEGIYFTIESTHFKSPLQNPSRTFREKYHNLFTELKQTKQPEGNYWEKYSHKILKSNKKFNDNLDIKAIQFKLEQQKNTALGYKKEFPFTERGSMKSERTLNKLRQSLDQQLFETKKERKQLYQNRKRSQKDEILNILHNNNNGNKYNNLFMSCDSISNRGISQDKISDMFLNKIKKKFPTFVKDGYLQKTFYMENGKNARISEMKNEINLKLYS
jgi:hypothetical protein